jgi:nitroreductase
MRSLIVAIVGAFWLGCSCPPPECPEPPKCPEPAAAEPAAEPERAPRFDREDGSPTTADLEFTTGKAVVLPPPTKTGGMPLLEALATRRSSREFAPDPLPLSVLSDLLWAATGVNRPEDGKLTAATARNWQNQRVFVATARGLFRYDPAAHALDPVLPDDLRAATGKQPFAGEAPVNLVYVSDLSKMEGVDDPWTLGVYSGGHAGLVAQNVYLFAASAGLATVLRAHLDKDALAGAMGLSPDEKVIMAQTVGLPAGQR